MSTTKNLAKYVKNIGVKLSELSKKTGIPYYSLYSSLGDDNGERELRATELTDICQILKINPMDFADKLEQRDKK